MVYRTLCIFWRPYPWYIIYQTPLPIVYLWYIEPPGYGISVYILSPLPMVYQPPVYSIHPFTNCISNPCLWYTKPSTYVVLNPLLIVFWATPTHPMVYWTSCLYFETSTHGVSNPSAYSIPHLPIVHRTPAYGLLIPQPMVFWTLCLRYFDRLPIVYQTPCL